MSAVPACVFGRAQAWFPYIPLELEFKVVVRHHAGAGSSARASSVSNH